MMEKQLSIVQFREHTPDTVFGFDELGLPTLIGVFIGATDLLDGVLGLVPQPDAGEEEFFLKANGTWANPADVLFNNESVQYDIPVTDADGDLITSGLFSPSSGKMIMSDATARLGKLNIFTQSEGVVVDQQNANLSGVQSLFSGIRRASGTAANGIGASIDLGVESNIDGNIKAGSISHILEDAVDAGSDSKWLFKGVRSNVGSDLFSINSNGDIDLGAVATGGTKRTIRALGGAGVPLEFDASGSQFLFSANGTEHLRFIIGGGVDTFKQNFNARVALQGYDAVAVNGAGNDVDIIGGAGNGSGADGSVNIYTQGNTGNPWVRIARPMLKASTSVADQGAGSAYFLSSSRFAFISEVVIGGTQTGIVIGQSIAQPVTAPATMPITPGYEYTFKAGNGSLSVGNESPGGDLFLAGGDAGNGEAGGNVYIDGGTPDGFVGQYGNLGLFGSPINFNGGERIAWWGNRVVSPSTGPTNGVYLFSNDFEGTSEFYVQSESGPVLNLSGLTDVVIAPNTTLLLDEDLHRGKFIYCTHASGCTVTVPPLKTGFNCVLLQDNTNVVSLTASGTTLHGKIATTGQYDSIALIHYKSSNIWVGI